MTRQDAESGAALYWLGAPIDQCTSEQERHNWLTASNVDADAQTETWMRESGWADEPAIEDDYSWIRTGC